MNIKRQRQMDYMEDIFKYLEDTTCTDYQQCILYEAVREINSTTGEPKLIFDKAIETVEQLN